MKKTRRSLSESTNIFRKLSLFLAPDSPRTRRTFRGHRFSLVFGGNAFRRPI